MNLSLVLFILKGISLRPEMKSLTKLFISRAQQFYNDDKLRGILINYLNCQIHLSPGPSFIEFLLPMKYNKFYYIGRIVEIFEDVTQYHDNFMNEPNNNKIDKIDIF